MGAIPHLANAALVAAFLAAMLVASSLFIEYRSIRIPTVDVVQVRGLPL
jgi:hypothetical protein